MSHTAHGSYSYSHGEALFLFLFRSFFTLTEGGPPPRVCRECLTTQVAEFRGEAEAGIEYCEQGNGGFVGTGWVESGSGIILGPLTHPKPPSKRVSLQVEYEPPRTGCKE